MYGKIFESMYDGTLADSWQALVTFQQMIVLADEDGVVDMTPGALSRRTGIPSDVIDAGLQVLSDPDEYSRSPDRDGRRIELLDEHRPWGWQIVNYRKYRQLASREEKKAADRQRIADKRAAEKQAKEADSVESSSDVSQGVADCREVSQGVADVAHTDTDTNTSTTTARATRDESDISLPFADGDFTPTETDINRWQASCPDIDVRQSLRGLLMYLDDHPDCKTRKLSLMFARGRVSDWLRQDQARAVQTKTDTRGQGNEKSNRRGNASPKPEIDWDADFELDPWAGYDAGEPEGGGGEAAGEDGGRTLEGEFSRVASGAVDAG